MEIGQLEWIVIGIVVVIGLAGFLGSRREPTKALGSDTYKATPAAAAAQGEDDVDPVAEAEVYLAYGRKTQAIEILEEALRDHPAREDVRKKLNEIKATK